MKSYKKYNTYEKERKVFALVMLIILLALIALAVLTACGVFDEAVWKPDVSYPMANTNISWEQTYHPGAWKQ